MKFIVAVDCEGVACAVGTPGGTLNDSKNWEFVRHQATREADAAAKGLFDAGATQVIVWDNHGGSLNLFHDDLDERCDIMLGVGVEHRWPGLDSSFAGVLMVGYHSKDNTPDAVMAHSFSSKTYQYMKVNGVEVGEIAIDAAAAGSMGVPAIFVSSDDKGVAEAKQFLPWVETVATKQGLGWNAAISKHPRRSAADIRAAAAAAVKRIREMKTFGFKEPITLEYRFKRMEEAQSAARSKSGWVRVDPYTVRKTIATLGEEF
ncbi:MAG: M55 family metallopeptidase [Phycisphaerae bacterium]